MRQDGGVTGASYEQVVSLEHWLEADPHLPAKSTLEALSSDPVGIAKLFASQISFGTAGLRAERGIGPTRMNRVTVRVAARAIGFYLLREGLEERGVVIGYDARPDSNLYATDTARLLTALGIPCWLIDEPCPTPVVVWNQRHQAAGAAIVVTASHNPASDGGYKVYGSDGTQIRPVAAKAIESFMDFSSLPLEAELSSESEISYLNASQAVAGYVKSVITPGEDNCKADGINWVYTPLCGVGGDALESACVRAGLQPPIRVEKQFDPDGSFPGLPFPNPEEPGTLHLAKLKAEDEGVGLILANDPDADRLAVVIRSDEEWRQLTGDELGLLLCDYQIRVTSGDTRLSASSVVSSEAVIALCKAHDIEHVRTLTGFKWIMEPAIAHPTKQWIFGYEEALGYSVTSEVLDKDGISSAIAFLRLVSDLKALGKGPLERLDELAQQIGLFVTDQVSGQFDPELVDATLNSLRNKPPLHLNGHEVTEVIDWLDAPEPSSTNLLQFRAEGGLRVAIRPSGTEPKVKIYMEQVTLEAPTNIREARSASKQDLASLGTFVLSWFT